MYFLGIDPGVTGACALINFDGTTMFVDNVVKMRIGENPQGRVRNCVNAKDTHEMLIKCTQGLQKDSINVYLEQVHARETDQAPTAFSLGDSFGVMRAIVNCMGLKLHFVTPQTWKKHFDIVKDKEVSRELAIKLFPEAGPLLKRKMDGDRAEALLIARYGLNVHKVI